MRIRSVIVNVAAWVVSGAGLCGPVMAQSFDLVQAPGGVNLSFNGVTADGMTAVAYSNMGGLGSFRWTQAGGLQSIPGLPTSAPALGISGDGTTVVGRNPAYRYRGPGTFQDLGTIGNLPDSWAQGVSGDGGVVAGVAFATGGPGVAWRWTQGTGIQPLGYARPTDTYSEAKAVSRDGGTIVGFSSGGGAPTTAFRWTVAGGMQALPLPVGDIFGGSASAVNHDGSVIVGNTGLPGSPPAIWRDGGAPTILPIPTGWANTGPRAASDDGSVVAGEGRNPSFQTEAWVWTQSRGSESLMSYLISQGVQIPAGWRLGRVNAISADGRTFVGVAALSADGSNAGFVATVPTPGVLVTVCAALLATSRRRRANRSPSV